MSFERPWLLLLALLPLAAYTRGARRTHRTLQALAAVALAIAAAGPHTGGHERATVLAVDQSASISPAARSVERAWTSRASAAIDFAADATRSSAEATDLGRGIAAAVDVAPRDGRVILLSDGASTRGDIAGAIAEARVRGVEVDAVPLFDPSVADVAVTRVATPQSVHLGDNVPLLVTIHSTFAGRAQLTIGRDGSKPASEDVSLHRGDNVIALSYVARSRGWHTLQARVRAADNSIAQNDAQAAVVDVGAPPRALLATTRASRLADELARSGVVVRTGSLPSQAADYAAYDVVVLDDLSGSALSQRQLSALGEAIRFGGTGLFVGGGPHSFSLGGYAGSQLDALLPVTSRVPGDLQQRNLALELVIDRSGSMGDRSGGVRKIAMAQRAALAATDFATTHRDELGVVDFDIAPHVAIPLARVSPARKAALAKQITRVTAAGGTDIYLGLRRGFEQLSRSNAPKRHLILLSDGISQPHDYAPLLARLRRAHVSVAAVALGASADAKLLRSIADGTGGNYYATSNAHALPRIFAREARLSAAPTKLTGTLHVSTVGASPILRSVAGRRLPPLTGVAATDAKPAAQVDLLAGRGSRATPALAQWQLGIGRVVAWTASVGPPWAAGWLRERTLWTDAVRWAARPVDAEPLDVRADAGPSPTVSVDLAGAGLGTVASLRATVGTQHVRLLERAPALYSGRVSTLAPGIVSVRVAGRTTPVAVPYPAEYRPQANRLGSLGEIVASAGGRLLGTSPQHELSAGRRDWTFAFLLAALALYAAGVVSATWSPARRPRRTAARAAERP